MAQRPLRGLAQMLSSLVMRMANRGSANAQLYSSRDIASELDSNTGQRPEAPRLKLFVKEKARCYLETVNSTRSLREQK